MNILTSSLMRRADEATIAGQQISSAKLMERAARAFVQVFKKEVAATAEITVLCGSGNNGGDGLAIARLLNKDGFKNITVCLVKFSEKQSPDFLLNLKRLHKLNIPVKALLTAADVKNIKDSILIDGVLGSGLNKPLTGAYLQLAKHINSKKLMVFAVDIPTGFPAEGGIPPGLTAIVADKVICFEQPKLNFFFPESAAYLKQFEVAAIGLDEHFIENSVTGWKLTDKKAIRKIIKQRASFSHKGTYGHALIVAGNEQTLGAALLSAKACLFGGAGLTTASLPKSGLAALNTSLPEIMYLPQAAAILKKNLVKFTAVAIGPGIGVTARSLALLKVLVTAGKPLVADADALNLLAGHKELLKALPSNSILTPHVKEFDRLFGKHASWQDRVETARKRAKAANLIIVLKNRYSFVALPDGNIHINPTGNPAMASGGMGDVLTGLITACLAQGYAPGDAAILACYLHGKAGDRLAKRRAYVTASEVAEMVPVVMKIVVAGC